ncbi:hypothetical protein [Amycolatopsis anabasis]|uniref:hypothetical protein n=1 Tax=Amycolatopsis anabasis TaxID=1840409 RepID=UPI00131CDDE7|nr:hypothetical protein [Amycolatopsis anabasis]
MERVLGELRSVVSRRVAEMPGHEAWFWDRADAAGVGRDHAGSMLDVAVDWIGTGRAESADPYALAASWLPR